MNSQIQMVKKTDEEILADLQQISECPIGFSWNGDTPVITCDDAICVCEGKFDQTECLSILRYFKERGYLKIAAVIGLALLLLPSWGWAASMSLKKQTTVNISGGGGGGSDPTKLPLGGGTLTGPVTSYSTLYLACASCTLTAPQLNLIGGATNQPAINLSLPSLSTGLFMSAGATPGRLVPLYTMATTADGAMFWRLSADGGTTRGAFARQVIGGSSRTRMFGNPGNSVDASDNGDILLLPSGASAGAVIMTPNLGTTIQGGVAGNSWNHSYTALNGASQIRFNFSPDGGTTNTTLSIGGSTATLTRGPLTSITLDGSGGGKVLLSAGATVQLNSTGSLLTFSQDTSIGAIGQATIHGDNTAQLTSLANALVTSDGNAVITGGNGSQNNKIQLTSGSGNGIQLSSPVDNKINFQQPPSMTGATTGTALCFSASGKLGHCTTAPLPACTCVSP